MGPTCACTATLVRSFEPTEKHLHSAFSRVERYFTIEYGSISRNSESVKIQKAKIWAGVGFNPNNFTDSIEGKPTRRERIGSQTAITSDDDAGAILHME